MTYLRPNKSRPNHPGRHLVPEAIGVQLQLEAESIYLMERIVNNP